MNYGRDRRRRLTLEEANLLYARAQGKCENCGDDLGADWHGAHGIAWSSGGATTIDEMRAQCAKCNLKLGAKDEEVFKEIILRDWQAQSLPKILTVLHASGFATLHAAPGAGKTIFAGLVFKRLYDLGIVKRMVIVVPNCALVKQWCDDLKVLKIHLDDQPRDNHIEHPNTVGLVHTYQALPQSAFAHAEDFKRIATLIVFDEVHHLGDNLSWGKAARMCAGDVLKNELHAEAVLNSTGTLFRSGGSRRISTVRYQNIENGSIQAIADCSVPTSDLIRLELRPPDVYVFGGEARLIDLRKEEEISGQIADLDVDQQHAVLRGAVFHREWRRGFL